VLNAFVYQGTVSGISVPVEAGVDMETGCKGFLKVWMRAFVSVALCLSSIVMNAGNLLILRSDRGFRTSKALV
jgi:hypothetical protein